MSEVHKCPVCEGIGYVPVGFYGGSTMAASSAPEMCRSCHGLGYIVIMEANAPSVWVYSEKPYLESHTTCTESD